MKSWSLAAVAAILLPVAAAGPALAGHPLEDPGEFRAEVTSLILIAVVVGLAVYGGGLRVVITPHGGSKALTAAHPWLMSALWLAMMVLGGLAAWSLADILLPPGHEEIAAWSGAGGVVMGATLIEGARAVVRKFAAKGSDADA